MANAKGVVVAKSVDDLHSAGNNLTKQTALNEKGAVVNGRGDTPNMHDALTGSQPDGTARGRRGPHLRQLDEQRGGRRHARPHRPPGPARRRRGEVLELVASSRGPGGGCSQDDLKSTGGAGLFYCFAAN